MSAPATAASGCLANPGCIKAALAIVGDKWSPLLLKALTEQPSLTFSALEAELAGISPRTLSQRLDALQASRVITKACYCQHPQRFTYSLTQKGSDLADVLKAMAEWSARYAGEGEEESPDTGF